MFQHDALEQAVTHDAIEVAAFLLEAGADVTYRIGHETYLFTVSGSVRWKEVVLRVRC